MRVVLVAHTEIVTDIPGYRTHNDWEEVYAIDELAEEAGRLCYLSWDRPNPKTATNEGYIANIIAQQHWSVLEHASATFYIDGVSRNFTHELIRHRHLSFSEVSQRYVNVGEFPLIEPPAVEGTAQADRIRGALSDVKELGAQVYECLVNDFTDSRLSRKEARQAARSILPGGLETKILVTGNMRAWREVLQKRLSPAADKEFQLVAQKILGHLREIAPNTFQDFE